MFVNISYSSPETSSEDCQEARCPNPIEICSASGNKIRVSTEFRVEARAASWNAEAAFLDVRVLSGVERFIKFQVRWNEVCESCSLETYVSDVQE